MKILPSQSSAKARKPVSVIQTNDITDAESLTDILTEANHSEIAPEMKNQLAKDGKCDGLRRKLQRTEPKTVLSVKSQDTLPNIAPTKPKHPK